MTVGFAKITLFLASPKPAGTVIAYKKYCHKLTYKLIFYSLKK